jgi:hypothetical protein
VLEMTRLGIEVKNLKMRVESLASRLDFDERRARALESAVVYRPAGENSEQASAGMGRSPAPTLPQQGVIGGDASRHPSSASGPSAGGTAAPEGPGQRSRRRRRRRGRRGGGAPMIGASGPASWGPRDDANQTSQEAAESSPIGQAESSGDAQAQEQRGETAPHDNAPSDDVRSDVSEPDTQ